MEAPHAFPSRLLTAPLASLSESKVRAGPGGKKCNRDSFPPLCLFFLLSFFPPFPLSSESHSPWLSRDEKETATKSFTEVKGPIKGQQPRHRGVGLVTGNPWVPHTLRPIAQCT